MSAPWYGTRSFVKSWEGNRGELHLPERVLYLPASALQDHADTVLSTVMLTRMQQFPAGLFRPRVLARVRRKLANPEVLETVTAMGVFAALTTPHPATDTVAWMQLDPVEALIHIVNSEYVGALPGFPYIHQELPPNLLGRECTESRKLGYQRVVNAYIPAMGRHTVWLLPDQEHSLGWLSAPMALLQILVDPRYRHTRVACSCANDSRGVSSPAAVTGLLAAYADVPPDLVEQMLEVGR